MTRRDKKYLCMYPVIQCIRLAKCVYRRQMEIFSNIVNFCRMKTSIKLLVVHLLNVLVLNALF